MLGEFPLADAPVASTPVTSVSIAYPAGDARNTGDVEVTEALGSQG